MQIPKSATEAELREVFEAHGEVEHINILESRGVHAGCAFVQYTRWAACEEAIAALHERCVMPGCDHALVVKFADAKRSEGAPGKRGGGGGSHAAALLGPHPPGMLVHGHPGGMLGGGYMGGDLMHMGMQHPAMGHPMGLPPMALAGMVPSHGPLGMLPPGRMRRRGLSSNDGGSSDSLADHTSSSDACELRAIALNISPACPAEPVAAVATCAARLGAPLGKRPPSPRT